MFRKGIVVLMILVLGASLFLALRERRQFESRRARAEGVAQNLPAGFDPDQPVWGYRVVKAYPHDPSAFTQGLVYHRGELLESTGLRERSSLRRVELETGRVLESRALDPRVFAEGLALVGDRLYQLTWTDQLAFVWKLEGLEYVKQLGYTGQGWGLAESGGRLVQSDGSAELVWRDPETFQELERVTVTAGGVPVSSLNELEMVEGELFANVWMTNFVARIDPATGKVRAWVDLSGLLTQQEALRADVLNGIAYDSENKRLFVTGKLWPRLFEVELSPPGSP